MHSTPKRPPAKGAAAKGAAGSVVGCREGDNATGAEAQPGREGLDNCSSEPALSLLECDRRLLDYLAMRAVRMMVSSRGRSGSTG